MRRKRKGQRPTRRVVSAGGVVLKGDPPEVLVVSLRGGRVVTLPKGQVEPGERYPETAVREVREETGVEASVLAPLGRVRYYFTVHEPEGPVTVSKEVHYFLMRHLGGTPRPQLTEVENAFFLPASEALEQNHGHHFEGHDSDTDLEQHDARQQRGLHDSEQRSG